MKSTERHRAGYTLVELLIVVFILAILAAVVVPQFGGTTVLAKESALSQTLRTVRQSIHLYRFQHNETWPDEDIVVQLTQGTDVIGDPGSDFGPYLRTGFPVNSLTGGSDIKVKSTMPAKPEGGRAWIYAKTTGEFRCNNSGNAPSGIAWFDL